ncbi:hypothetical protein Tco_0590516 [Tanacetum coccineum]
MRCLYPIEECANCDEQQLLRKFLLLAWNPSTDPSELYLILNTYFDLIGDLFDGRDVRIQVSLDSKALSSLFIASIHLESFEACGGGVGMDVIGDVLLVESALFEDDGVDGVKYCDVEGEE